jgi:hypothetical protein
MTAEEIIRTTAAINYEIVITHGLDGGVGFEWQGAFIHDPFSNPQYGAFDVDPIEQYGDAYTASIFVTDPTQALQMAQRQMRGRATADLGRYCVEHEVPATALIESVCGMRVADSRLTTLTDEQVVAVWSHVDDAASGSGKI